MNARLVSLLGLFVSLATTGFAADEEPTKKPTRNEAMRTKMVEDAKSQAAKPAAPTASKPIPSTAQTSGAAPAAVATQPVATTPTEQPATATPADEPTTILPKMEVNRSKLHPLARELYEKEREITREKELTKPTELDKALNHPKLSLGGQSSTSRASVASERTSLLQAEADLIEEIGRAKTKEQKAELRKQLDELKKIRRDLEQAIR